MKILLVHQNFPGQFRELAPELLARGHDVRALSMRREGLVLGVPNLSYTAGRSSTPNLHSWLVNTESAVIRGQAAALKAQQMAESGWVPDLVLGHTGWGEMLFMREVFPYARLLTFNELYYRAEGGDVGFDPEFPKDKSAAMRLQVRNLHLQASLLASDEGVTPTQWQASCFPDPLRHRLRVIHDGIQTDRLVPDRRSWVSLGRDRKQLRFGDELVTFVNRNLEPMRGFHQFMRAVPEILARRPNARIVIVGGNDVSYGARPPAGQSYKEIYLSEIKNRLDMSRLHFVDRVPYSVLINLFNVSAVHVYLTVPFVLSWSMMEAMSVGALVVGSDTEPVKEVIRHGENGLLVDFFRPDQLADSVVQCLRNPREHAHLRIAARQTVVEQYDFKSICLPRYLSWLDA